MYGQMMIQKVDIIDAMSLFHRRSEKVGFVEMSQSALERAIETTDFAEETDPGDGDTVWTVGGFEIKQSDALNADIVRIHSAETDSFVIADGNGAEFVNIG